MPLLKQVPHSKLHDSVQVGFELLQRRIHPLCGQPVPVLCYADGTEALPRFKSRSSSRAGRCLCPALLMPGAVVPGGLSHRLEMGAGSGAELPPPRQGRWEQKALCNNS